MTNNPQLATLVTPEVFKQVLKDSGITPQLSEEHYVKIWKYYSDELLDKAQRLIESDLGYNGTDVLGLCWVPIYEGTDKEDKLHMPCLPDGLAHAIILAVKHKVPSQEGDWEERYDQWFEEQYDTSGWEMKLRNFIENEIQHAVEQREKGIEKEVERIMKFVSGRDEALQAIKKAISTK